ncbi:MAG: transposase [Phormidesmis sp. CAN_BIN44]|nr:transposase [Phormidesmis sp. CAN_BIN44]
MLDVDRVLRQDRLMRAMTGLNLKAFARLLVSFSMASDQAEQQDSTPRQRARGGGRKPRLAGIDQQLFFVLFYFKCYPTFDLAGILFDLDRSQANRWLHRLQLILEAALGKQLALPERKLESVEQFVSRFPGVKRVMIDGTERPIQRPQDPERQTETYSGRKRRNACKHIAAVDEIKRVLVLSVAQDGRHHDKRLLDELGIVRAIPSEIAIEVALGFQGLQNQVDNILIGHKKPRGGSLTQAQKDFNRALSRSRVVCENAFAGVKRYGAVSAVYRNRVTHFDDRLMLTATGLWNFYLMAA